METPGFPSFVEKLSSEEVLFPAIHRADSASPTKRKVLFHSERVERWKRQKIQRVFNARCLRYQQAMVPSTVRWKNNKVLASINKLNLLLNRKLLTAPRWFCSLWECIVLPWGPETDKEKQGNKIMARKITPSSQAHTLESPEEESALEVDCQIDSHWNCSLNPSDKPHFHRDD